MSRAVARVVLGLAVLLLALGVARSARAEDRVSRLSQLLTSSDDFRVRTQAALALGASKTKRAVDPLCAGLRDASTSVRAASAAALGKLRKGGAKCLEDRLESESKASVKSVIKKALARLGGGEVAPTIGEGTDYYVAIVVKDNTERSDQSAEARVRKGMGKAAQKLGNFALAPSGESRSQAEKLLAKHSGLKAFMLSTKVKKPKYADGNLSLKLEVAIFTYPGRALKGTYTVKLTQQGTNSEDTASENQLIEMCAERAMEKFSKAAERIQ
jgi:hypothetical protein